MITEEDIREAIAQTVPNLNAASVGVGQDFFDAGLDSLDHASLLLDLQEKHGLEVPDEDVEKCRTIQAILDYAKTTSDIR